MMDVGVYRLPMAGPDDVSELAKLIDNGTIRAEEVFAIIAQTEGDGYARGYAALTGDVVHDGVEAYAAFGDEAHGGIFVADKTFYVYNFVARF